MSIIKEREIGLENSSNRFNYALDMILNDRSWEEIANYPNLVQAITKNDVIDVANKYFNEDYLVFKSKIGFPKKDKVQKPPYKPVKPKNSEQISEYATLLNDIPSGDIKIDFLNFKKDTDYEKIRKNYHFYYNQNPINSIFSLRLEWGIGKYENNSLFFATSFGSMIGNEQYTFNELKEELQKI